MCESEALSRTNKQEESFPQCIRTLQHLDCTIGEGGDNTVLLPHTRPFRELLLPCTRRWNIYF